MLLRTLFVLLITIHLTITQTPEIEEKEEYLDGDVPNSFGNLLDDTSLFEMTTENDQENSDGSNQGDEIEEEELDEYKQDYQQNANDNQEEEEEEEEEEAKEESPKESNQSDTDEKEGEYFEESEHDATDDEDIKQVSDPIIPSIDIGTISVNFTIESSQPIPQKNPKYQFTSYSGAPIEDPYHTITIGSYGPIPMIDSSFQSQIQHFDRERIPERVYGARGAGASGYFKCTTKLGKKISKSGILTEVGSKTPIAVRFSTMNTGKGSPDLQFDMRGVGIKFYSDQGNWDLLFLSCPVFPIRDPLKFINLVHSQRKDPKNNVYSYNRFWDYISLNPETLNSIVRQFSGCGTTKGYRLTNYYSINTFRSFRGDDEEVYYIRFKLELPDGIEPYALSLRELKDLSSDPDWATRDLYKTIKRKGWTFILKVQVIKGTEISKLPFNPFDATKEWPEDKIKPLELGEIVLNRNPTNYFTQVEQIAFDPSNVPPGIETTFGDTVLQGRLFTYLDAQYYRLGANFNLLPINLPPGGVYAIHQPDVRDGAGRCDWNYGSLPDYLKNHEFNVYIGKEKVYGKVGYLEDITRFNRDAKDNYSQVRKFLARIDKSTKKLLIENMSQHLGKAKKKTQAKFLKRAKKISEKFYEALKRALKSRESVGI
ncbi:catalase-like [Brevipalpus obovatus]|uniref:catalase-like n=1 Tax=Brevipalpus obovatus TaxID=246614 RepID=UPI003D9E10DE